MALLRAPCAWARFVRATMWVALAVALLPRIGVARIVNDGDDPNANGKARVLNVQTDDKTLVGARLTRVA